MNKKFINLNIGNNNYFNSYLFEDVFLFIILSIDKQKNIILPSKFNIKSNLYSNIKILNSCRL